MTEKTRRWNQPEQDDLFLPSPYPIGWSLFDLRASVLTIRTWAWSCGFGPCHAEATEFGRKLVKRVYVMTSVQAFGGQSSSITKVIAPLRTGHTW